MPRHRLTQHGMDVVFKLEAQQLGSALSRRFGINFPRVVRHFPTDLPVADVHLEQLDSVFELADGSLLHLEFQTEHRRETLARFLVYDAYLYERYGRAIHTVVFYGAGVASVEASIEGGAIHYRVENVLLGEQDGDTTYQRLSERLARAGKLTPEERLDLVLLPLMRHQRVRREVVADAIGLAQRLPEQQQRQTVAALIGLGHRFLTTEELDTLLEGLMVTPIGQRLIDIGVERGIEQGIEQGIERGIERGRRQEAERSLRRVLATRFGALPATLDARIASIDNQQRLEALLDTALTVASVEEFSQAL